MSERYNKLFGGLKKSSEGAFIPFVMVGDPGMEEVSPREQTGHAAP